MSRLSAGTRAAVCGLVAAAVLTACNGDEPSPPPPTPTQAVTSEEPTPIETATSVEPTPTTPRPTEPGGPDTALPEVTEDPANAHPLPEAAPESFGDWTAEEGTVLPRGAIYTNPAGDLIIANHVDLENAQDGLQRIQEAEFVNNWYCGRSIAVDGQDLCFTSAFGAQVSLMSDALTYDEMAAFGEELLAHWK